MTIGNWASYTSISKNVQMNGLKASPRGQKTSELFNGTISFLPDVVINRRGMNRTLMVVETLMWAAGIFDLELIEQAAPNAKLRLYEKQSDYGPRTIEQFSNVCKLLAKDSQTRKAVVNLNTREELETMGDDMACTNSMQFYIRNDVLRSIVTVRSWDMAYGFPMDIFMYSFMTRMVGECIGVDVGNITVNFGSLHVYDTTAHLAMETKRPTRWMLGPSLAFSNNHSDFSATCLDSLLRWKEDGDNQHLYNAICPDASQFRMDDVFHFIMHD